MGPVLGPGSRLSYEMEPLLPRSFWSSVRTMTRSPCFAGLSLLTCDVEWRGRGCWLTLHCLLTCANCSHMPPPPPRRHKEDVYENLQSKNRREEKVKKQRSADKDKSKGSLKRK